MRESLHTLFLAQVMGLYLLIIGIIMLARATYYRDLLTHIKNGSAATVTGASIGLVLGLFLVIIHNIWIWESDVLVTVVAWFLLIKSVLWLAFPETMVKCAHKLYSGAGFYVAAIITGIIGVILTAHGFYLFQAHKFIVIT